MSFEIPEGLFGSAPSESEDTGGGGIAGIIRNAAERYGVDPDIMVSLAQRESSLNPRAHNPHSSAAGLFQFTDATWKDYGDGDKTDPEANADAAARMMKANLARFGGDYDLALAAHHVGPGKARQALSDVSVGDRDVSTQDWLADIKAGGGSRGTGGGAGGGAPAEADPGDWLRKVAARYGSFEEVPEAAPAVPEEGDFFRGAKIALGQTPALFKGLVGLAGETGEQVFGKGGISSAVKQWGLEGYKEDMAQVSEHQKETDSPTEAWKRAKAGDYGALLDMVEYGAGYGLGQIAESALIGIGGAIVGGATSGFGAVPGAAAGVVGKSAVKGFMKNLVEKAVAKRAATAMASESTQMALAKGTLTREAAELAARKFATKEVAQGLGAATALGGYNVMMEGGSIYPEAMAQAAKEGRDLDGGDVARIWGATFAAAATETAADALGLGAAFGKIHIPGAGRAGRAFVGGVGGGLLEGGQEATQTVLERYGAQQEIFSDEGLKDIIDSAVLGAIPGVGGGVVVGAAQRSAARKQQKDQEDILAAPDVGPALEAFERSVQPTTGQTPEVDAILAERPDTPTTDLAAEAAGVIDEYQAMGRTLQDAPYVAPMDPQGLQDYLDTTPSEAVAGDLLSADQQSFERVLRAATPEQRDEITDVLTETLRGMPNDTLRAAGGYAADLALQHREEQAKQAAFARAEAQRAQQNAREAEQGILEPTRDLGVEQAAAMSEAAGVNAGEPTAMAQALAGAKPDLQAQRRAAEVAKARGLQTTRQAAQTRLQQVAENEQGVFSTARESAPTAEDIAAVEETPVERRGAGQIAGRPAAEITDAELRAQFPQSTGSTRNAIAHEMTVRGIAPAQSSTPSAQTSEAAPVVGEVAQGQDETSKLVAATLSPKAKGQVSAQVVSQEDAAQSGADATAAGVLAKLFKKKVVWFRASQKTANGEHVKNSIGGFVHANDASTIYLNADSAESVVAVFAHEILHLIKTQHAEIYAMLRNKVRADFDAHPEQFAKFRKYYNDASLSDDALLEEAIADALGNQATRPQFWANVFDRVAAKHGNAKAKGIIARLREALVRLIGRTVAELQGRKGFANYITNLEKMQAAFEEAAAKYVEAVRTGETAAPGETRFTQARPQEQANAEEATPPVARPAQAAQQLRAGPGRTHSGTAPSYGTARANAIAVTGTHYSKDTRTELNGNYYGTGIKGEEAARLRDADPQLRQRVYFYVDTGKGVKPEPGLGQYAHEVDLQNVYDLTADPLHMLQADKNAMELAIVKAGFDGYLNRNFGNMGAVVLLGKRSLAVPVVTVGTGPLPASGRTLPPPVLSPERQLVKQLVAAKDLPAGQMAASRWGRLLEATHPELFGPLNKAGLFNSEEVVYKDELGGQYIRQARAKFSVQREPGSNQTLPARWPKSKRSTATVTDELLSDFPTLAKEPAQFKKAVDAVAGEPGMKVPGGATEERAAALIERMKENLLWLYDQIPEHVRERSKLWYDGARKIADDWTTQYGISRGQAAGILAVFSPQKDWFMNVTLAERMLDIARDRQDHKFDAKMDGAAFGMLTKDVLKPAEKQANLKAYDRIHGKTLGQLMEAGDMLGAGIWIRAYDEAHHAKEHAVVSPEGQFLEDQTTVGGEKTQAAWGDFKSIGKAVSIFLDGSAENISKQLGQEHKVRNFYNNIFEPKDPRFTTIDTHAVAAALLRALGGESKAVKDNFGGAGTNDITGIRGSYPLYFEAYKQAAEARGILPREMQSVTWEAVRGLFTEGFKGKEANVAKIDSLWRAVDAGAKTPAQARQQAFDLAGGIENPDWLAATAFEPVLRDKTYIPTAPAFRGSTMTFEVAPDPRQRALTARWNALGIPTQDKIARRVIWQIVAKAMASSGSDNLKGALLNQRGGFGDEVNTSFTVQFNKRAPGVQIGELVRVLGSALKQQSMIRTSPRSFTTITGEKATKMGAVLVELPSTVSQPEQIDSLYRELRTLKQGRKPIVGGHTTSDGIMVIFNHEPWSGISDEALAQRVGDFLHGRYKVHLDHRYVEFAEKGKDDYGLRTVAEEAGGAGTKPSTRARADQLRGESTALLADLIDRAERGVSFSTARGTAAAAFSSARLNALKAAALAGGEEEKSALAKALAAQPKAGFAVQGDLPGGGYALLGPVSGEWTLSHFNADGLPAGEETFVKQRQAVDALLDRVKLDTLTDAFASFSNERKAPNGKPSKLTEQQYAQVRTPAFKAWFGDWEAFATQPAGVWNDAEGVVSKAVDPETGEPKVFYHGSTEAGFTVFEPERNPRGTPASFFAADLPTALTYSGRRAEEVQIMDEAARQPGFYPVFLNVRNPFERDFEGAHWDGSRVGQYEVVNDEEEVAYSPTGQRFFPSEEEAQELADENPGFEVREAFDEPDSTNTVVEEARRYKHDSAIIRNVTDPGQYGDNYDTTDVFAVFKPNQVKSATQNTGAFSAGNEDIRFANARFVSPLRQAVEATKLETQPAAQWAMWLKSNAAKAGVKSDELQWSGVLDWLALRGKDKLSKAEVLDYLAGNGVRVNETRLGMPADTYDIEQFLLEKGYDRDAINEMPEEELMDTAADEGWTKNALPKYGSYTLPGGTNYREVLLTTPVRASSPKADEAQKLLDASDIAPAFRRGIQEGIERMRDEARAQVAYRSPHWDQPNVLAHLRLNDRTDAEGKRVLFVEEIQSDWAQEGKKKGFGGVPVFEVRSIETGRRLGAYQTREEAQDRIDRAARPEWFQLVEAKEEGIPAAPFVTDTKAWVALALKHAIMEAVQGGYDKVAFVTGAQSAARYDLSKQVDSLHLYADNTVVARKDGLNVLEKPFKDEAELAGIIGKDLAQKLLAAKPDMNDQRSLSGIALKVGGEGMEAFYDRIVPQVTRDVLKKLGGPELGTTSVQSKDQPAFDITPEMRAKIEEKGIPLFSTPRFPGKPAASWQTPPARPVPLVKTILGADLDGIRYKLQDKFIDLKNVVKAIGTVADKWDAYLQEELFHGRASEATKAFLSTELRPLLEEMRARGVSRDDFETYLWNRHAEERNVQVAKINPKMPDSGSGISTADARAYLAGLGQQQKANLEALAKKVDAINAGTRKMLVDYGLEKAGTIAAWEAAYSKYVPLHREDDTSYASAEGMGTGQGFNVKGSASKRALGSLKPVGNILANLTQMRERTITRGEKNRVAMSLYGLAIQNPNPEFWAPIRPGQTPAEVQQALTDMGINPADAKNAALVPTERYVDERTGLVVERPNTLFLTAPNIVTARVNGENRYLAINANDEVGARMATSLKNLDAAEVGWLLGTVARITRWFAAVNTQYNPIFGVVNLTRDVQDAALNLSATPLAGKQGQVVKDVGSALAGIYRDIRAMRKGHPATSKWAALWEEFQAEGGATGYREVFGDTQARADALDKEIKALGRGAVLRAGGALMDWLSDYNETMENATRLAAYKAAKDAGLSNARAASLAKNLTVNFNRKGQVAGQAGLLYAFFNASAQGTARMAKTLAGPAGRKIIAGGILLGAMQALLMAALGFKDDDIPEFVKERNLIIPAPGTDKGFLTIPMPLGFHILPNMGRLVVETASSPEKAGKNLAALVGLMLDSFNPIGSAGLSVQTISPTAFDPLVALGENKDWTGKSISREDFNSLAPTPGHARAKNTATIWAKALSRGLNWITGGTEYVPGGFSPTPDQIDYLFGQVGGGVMREVGKAAQVLESLYTGEALPTHKIPLAGRFYGQATEKENAGSKFYANITRLNEVEAEVKGRRKEGPAGDVRGYLTEHPEAGLVEAAGHAESEVRKLNKRKHELVKAGASREMIRQLEDRITGVMSRFNARVDALEER